MADLFACMTGFLTCLILLQLSYRAGGPAWVRLYPIPIRLFDQSYRVPGIVAGSVLCSMVFGGFVTASLTSRDFTLFDNKFLYGPMLCTYLIILLFCSIHARAKVRANSIDQHDYIYLKGAYSFYRFYAAAFWFFALLGLIKIFGQFQFEIDFQRNQLLQFSDQIHLFTGNWESSFTEEMLIKIELVDSQYSTLSRSLIGQIEPITFYAVYWIFIGLAVKLTPIGRVIESSAQLIGYYVTPAFLTIVVVSSVWVYFSQFLSLSNMTLELYDHVLELEHTSSERIQRIVELKNEALRYTGISGFFRVFSDEGGLYIVGLAATQALINVYSRPKAEVVE